MSQLYVFPPGFSTVTNPSVGLNGATAPTSSTEIGGINPGGNLNPLQTDASGNLLVNLAAPTGLATAANQTLEITQLTNIDAKLPAALGAQTIANSLSVNIASNQTVPVSAASLPLPIGAATSANQTTALTRLSGSLVPTAYDEIDLTYVPSGNGAGQIATAVYKLATITVKTLTLSYDSSDRLTSTVAS